MENVDGAAIHYELQKEHPTWKFHVARFNSLGKEFYYEHFQQDTIHSEAMGLTRIYDRYVPDMIVDNHRAMNGSSSFRVIPPRLTKASGFRDLCFMVISGM